jgi:hypothetical protein
VVQDSHNKEDVTVGRGKIVLANWAVVHHAPHLQDSSSHAMEDTLDKIHLGVQPPSIVIPIKFAIRRIPSTSRLSSGCPWFILLHLHTNYGLLPLSTSVCGRGLCMVVGMSGRGFLMVG